MGELSVFISYAREDIDIAVRLYKELKEKGIEPWLDVEFLRPGQKWKRAIKQAIKNSRYFLALLSSRSVSKVGYVNKEMSEALEWLEMFPESEVYLIPVRLDNCQPSYEKLRELHWVDLFPSWEIGVARIVDSISKDVEFRGESRAASEVEGAIKSGRPAMTQQFERPTEHYTQELFPFSGQNNKWMSVIEPVKYTPDAGLRGAVNVALSLGQPLLVTGEPGVGQAQLATSIAYELKLQPPLVFRVKTTSTASDLLYSYDAALRLHDLQVNKEQVPVERYLNFGVLGVAILLSLSPAMADPLLPISLRGSGPRRSVVLIDGIDSAPRDLPNDILDVLDEMSFMVKEVGQTFRADLAYIPVVIFTSNSEKELPDAFLSRCVYYQIPFPDRFHLIEMINSRFETHYNLAPQLLENAVTHFLAIRQLGLRKLPAIAELFGWVSFLVQNNVDVGTLTRNDVEKVTASYSMLAKNAEDIMKLRSFLDRQLHT